MKEENNNCRFFHNWNKWQDIDISGSEHVYIKQIRECKKCAKKKGRSVCYVNQVK
jgi:hypothetical protein